MEKLKEIEERRARLPRRLQMKETHVPRMIKDLATGRPIVDPRGGADQSRIDIIEVDDPAMRPWIHFHLYRDHPMYLPDAKGIAETVSELLSNDIYYLISEIKRLKGEPSDGSNC